MQNLAETLQLFIDFVGDAISSAVDFLAKLPEMLSFLRIIFSMIPVEVRGFALLSVSLSVLLMFVSFIRTDTTGG